MGSYARGLTLPGYLRSFFFFTEQPSADRRYIIGTPWKTLQGGTYLERTDS